MFRALFLLLISRTVAAWAPDTRISQGCFAPSDKSLRATSRNDINEAITSRRGMLGTIFTAASLTLLPSISVARDRSCAVPSNTWPCAPSPLPPVSRSPSLASSSFTVSYDADNDPLASFGAELSGMKTINSSPAPVNATGGGLDQAIDQSMKKKRIDPRTHG